MESGSRYYSRGRLPHWDVGRATQFITWRLHDSLPKDVWDQCRAEHQQARPDDPTTFHHRVDDALDAGHGACLLQSHRARAAFVEYLRTKNGQQWRLEAFVVMPNHAHVLVTLAKGTTLPEVVQHLKGGTSFAVNQALDRTGKLWQDDYFDRVIRDDEQLRRTAEYIEWNPVKAKLAPTPEAYPWSSANPSAQLWLSANAPHG